MDLEQKLIEFAREATATRPSPATSNRCGTTRRVAAGSAAGSVLGDAAVGGIAQAIGSAAGHTAGRYTATSGEPPPGIVLAASPDDLYLMTSNNAQGIIVAKHPVLIDNPDRADLSVERRRNVSVRTAVITTRGQVWIQDRGQAHPVPPT